MHYKLFESLRFYFLLLPLTPQCTKAVEVLKVINHFFGINTCTAMANKIYTPIIQALWKWDHFDRAKPILKILLVFLTDTTFVEEV